MAEERIKIQGSPFSASPAPAQARETKAMPKDDKARQPAAPKDTFREIVETIVFVIVLVLLLKTFVAEAFVIPTGSMATTLLGYHKHVTCPQCGHQFVVNTSKEMDEQEPTHPPVTGCTCENCGFHIILRQPTINRD
jgi:signal peptidase I